MFHMERVVGEAATHPPVHYKNRLWLPAHRGPRKKHKHPSARMQNYESHRDGATYDLTTERRLADFGLGERNYPEGEHLYPHTSWPLCVDECGLPRAGRCCRLPPEGTWWPVCPSPPPQGRHSGGVGDSHRWYSWSVTTNVGMGSD